MSPGSPGAVGGPVRVVRVIARLNIGGPAIQAITLTRPARAARISDRLWCAAARSPTRATWITWRIGWVSPVLISTMRRNPGWHDVLALVSLIGIIRRERPHIVHTHAAKAGTLGRCAALIARIGHGPRPVLIHTFHGHSLTGYFSPRTAAVYRQIERWLARHTDLLIAVSDEVRDELVRLGSRTPAVSPSCRWGSI